jgi:hypothetical protein
MCQHSISNTPVYLKMLQQPKLLRWRFCCWCSCLQELLRGELRQKQLREQQYAHINGIKIHNQWRKIMRLAKVRCGNCEHRPLRQRLQLQLVVQSGVATPALSSRVIECSSSSSRSRRSNSSCIARSFKASACHYVST